MEKFKKTILFDLDGVLNTYDGKYDKNNIPPIKEGAYIMMENMIKIIFRQLRKGHIA